MTTLLKTSVGAAFGLMVLAGCSPQGPSPTPSTFAPEKVITTPATPSTSEAATNDAYAKAPDTWDEAVLGRSFDDLVEEQRTLARESAEAGEKLFGRDRELDVPLVRVVDLHEWGQVQVDCFAENGFPVTSHPDGSILVGDVPDEQGEALNYTAYVCEMQYPLNPYTQMPPPKQAAEQLWEYWAGEATECLTAAGISTGEPPSKQRWLEEVVTRGALIWTPFDSVDRSVDQALKDSTYNKCARYPADYFPTAN